MVAYNLRDHPSKTSGRKVGGVGQSGRPRTGGGGSWSSTVRPEKTFFWPDFFVPEKTFFGVFGSPYWSPTPPPLWIAIYFGPDRNIF